VGRNRKKKKGKTFPAPHAGNGGRDSPVLFLKILVLIGISKGKSDEPWQRLFVFKLPSFAAKCSQLLLYIVLNISDSL
jgi:hypothetical protein